MSLLAKLDLKRFPAELEVPFKILSLNPTVREKIKEISESFFVNEIELQI